MHAIYMDNNNPSIFNSFSHPQPQNDHHIPDLPPSGGGRSSQRRHPVYRGIRWRSGKWVSEIREPKKTSRIWLGTYLTPEMAAAAYDVAALVLKGPDAAVNFPEAVTSYPVPHSQAAADIRDAAARAAASRAPPPRTEVAAASSSAPPQQDQQGMNIVGPTPEFLDEEALFNMPNLMVDMAQGMMISPPRINNSPPPRHHSPDYSTAFSFWNYP